MSCTIEDFWATNVRHSIFRNSADRKENPVSNPDRFSYMSCHKAPIDRHIYIVMAKVQTLIKLQRKNHLLQQCLWTHTVSSLHNVFYQIWLALPHL